MITASKKSAKLSSVRPSLPPSPLRKLTQKDGRAEATARADSVFQPILDARTKADRLKSTLGVFERSKFFFNLPGILGEAVEAVSFLLAL